MNLLSGYLPICWTGSNWCEVTTSVARCGAHGRAEIGCGDRSGRGITPFINSSSRTGVQCGISFVLTSGVSRHDTAQFITSSGWGREVGEDSRYKGGVGALVVICGVVSDGAC